MRETFIRRNLPTDVAINRQIEVVIIAFQVSFHTKSGSITYFQARKNEHKNPEVQNSDGNDKTKKKHLFPDKIPHTKRTAESNK